MKPLSTLTGILLLSAASLTPAQNLTSYGSGGFGMNSSYAKLYNRSSVLTFRGKVTGITVGNAFPGAGNSVRLIVRATNGGSMLVEVGPQWFVDNQRLKLHLKDKIAVTGSKVLLDNRGSIMAQKIVKGRVVMVLRDTAGHPYWAANQDAFRPTSYVVNSTTGSAAQTISSNNAAAVVARAQLQQLAVMPNNGTAPVYMSPSVVNGTIDKFTNVNGNIFMYLHAAGSDLVVSLGPSWYIQRQDATLNPGDLVSATILSPIPSTNGISYAQSVTGGNGTMYFLNDVGMANWAPWYPVAWPAPRMVPIAK